MVRIQLCAKLGELEVAHLSSEPYAAAHGRVAHVPSLCASRYSADDPSESVAGWLIGWLAVAVLVFDSFGSSCFRLKVGEGLRGDQHLCDHNHLCS